METRAALTRAALTRAALTWAARDSIYLLPPVFG